MTVNKKIHLTQGKYALVDEADYEWLNQWRWHISHGYARRNAIINGLKTTVSMHQQLMGFVGKDIDHINGDRLDNRRSNLRICNDMLNQRNRKINYNKKFKGVNWHKKIGAWQVCIRIDKKLKHLGTFDNEIMAAKAYNKAARRYFGEYARLNNV